MCPDRSDEEGRVPSGGLLVGRHVIVTGGAQGIGAAVAVAVATQGAHVSIGDVRDPDEVVATIKAAGGRATGGTCDIGSTASVERFVADVTAQRGPVNGLVNNAAMFSSLRPRPFEEISSEEFDEVMQINVRGTFEVIKAVVPHMRQQGYGKIVNIGSSSVLKGAQMLLHYTASKGAVHAMTRVLARELGPDGIRVNCLAPGLTISDGVRDAGNLPPERIAADMVTRCLPREQTPGDLTGTATFLLSEHSDFMTGQLVVVDGGSMLN